MEINLNNKEGALPSAEELSTVKKIFPNRDPLEAYQWWDSVGFPVTELMNAVTPVDTPIDELPSSIARTYGEKLPEGLAKYYANKRLSGTGMSGSELAMLQNQDKLGAIPELMNRFAREVPIVEFTPEDAKFGVFGDVSLDRVKMKAEDFTEQSAQKTADAFTTGYGLKTLPLYAFPLTEPLAIGIDILEGIATRDPIQTGTAALLSQSMSPKAQAVIAGASVFMPFDAEAVKIIGSPELFSGVVEKIKGAPSKARGEELKQKPENWMGGMLKGGTTLKINNMEIPIKTSEVENMMRLIKNNKLDDKLLTKDEMVKVLEDQYYTSFISEKTSPAYFNRLGDMEVTKIELPKDGDVTKDLLEISNYTTRDAGVHHGGEQGIISHSLIRKDNNAYEITEIQSDMASDAHKFGMRGSPKNNFFQDLIKQFKRRNRDAPAFDDFGESTIERSPAGIQNDDYLPNIFKIYTSSQYGKAPSSVLSENSAKTRNRMIEKYGRGDAIGGGNNVDTYAAAIFDKYKNAINEVDDLYTNDYLEKIYDLSTDKAFKNKYNKEEFATSTRKAMKDKIIRSIRTENPTGANVTEILNNIASGYTTSPKSLWESVHKNLTKKVEDLHSVSDELGEDAADLEVFNEFKKVDFDLRRFSKHMQNNPLNSGSVPAQTPLMKNLDYVEFEIKKHLVKAAKQDQSKFMLPGEEPLRYWAKRGQDEKFLKTIYSLAPDSKKGYKGKIGQVLTKLSKKYNIPFRLEGKVDLDNRNLYNIFKEEKNNLENLADLSDSTYRIIGNSGTFNNLDTSPYEALLSDATQKQTDRIRNLREEYADSVSEGGGDFSSAEASFNNNILEDPQDFIYQSDMMGVLDWEGMSEGFDLMAKNTESKSVKLASEMFSNITKKTKKNYETNLQLIEDFADDANNAEDLFNIVLIKASRKAESDYINSLPEIKKNELMDLGIIGMDQNARFVIELPDVVKEQIIEQGFPITGL